jgi:Zn-dependent alcohol dehydrogenase
MEEKGQAPNVARAIVAHEPRLSSGANRRNWKLEDVKLRDLQPKELLVRMVATGICYTDLIFGTTGRNYPKVLGHEGK